MRKMLIFEATPELPGGGLLLQLAVTLRQLNINPERLAWEVKGSDGMLKVRLVLRSEDKRWLPAIADQLRAIPGVREVRCLSLTDPPAGSTPADIESSFMD
jgi:hypothetical protein